MSTPEQLARVKIDELLTDAGWVLQDYTHFDRQAALGVAVREFQLPNGPCDYLLFVEGKAAGVIEAKKAGITLSAVAEQSDKYMIQLPEHLRSWAPTLLLGYESNGEETFFRCMKDPSPRSRRTFAFHRPETLLGWLRGEKTLRAGLKAMPPLAKNGLRDCQFDAIQGLETSLAADNPRALIQMATGAGKTFTACNFSYRLIKHAGAKRILFLVDRSNLGRQTLTEFQQFAPPGEGENFDKLYITQHLQRNNIDPNAKVVITTIQRLYSMLRGEELDEADEEASGFEVWKNADGEIPPVGYNPNIPIETFDFIITDECHRSIYGLWRQVLEYFDAHIIGLTATPSMHTLAFFNQNLVAEYPYERSVADGVNVGYEVYRIQTNVTAQGGVVDADYAVPVRDKRTRALRYKQLDENLEFTAQELDRSVTVPNQIRAVIRCYKEKLFTELFPGRTGEWVPKTLIFAKDDNHAEEIVHIVREVFGAGNDFCKKITYRNSEDPKSLIQSFRLDPKFRVAVTVDMIATGTDIKPLEVLIFMRDVKSEGYYEQMKGRGVRTIKDADLKAVTPDAQTKTRFILIDAVGVTEGKKTVSQPLERKRNLSFEQLLNQIAQGRCDVDAFSSLAGRLSALEKKLEPEDVERIVTATGGATLRHIANALLDAVEPDAVEEAAKGAFGPTPTEAQLKQVQEDLADKATAVLTPKVRELLVTIKQKTDIVIADTVADHVVGAGYDLKKAEEKVTSWKVFLEANKAEITALQILYNQPYNIRQLSYAQLKELAAVMKDPPFHLLPVDIWQAYARLNAAVVRGAPVEDQLTEIIQLVRFTLGQEAVLEPFSARVEQKFNLWRGRYIKKHDKDFTEEQLEWLRLIRGYIAANVAIEPRSLLEDPSLNERGGLVKAQALFGPGLKDLLNELNEVLVA